MGPHQGVRWNLAAEVVFVLMLMASTQVLADGWLHTRGRGQVKLPSAGNRYLKSHAHAAGNGLVHSDVQHRR